MSSRFYGPAKSGDWNEDAEHENGNYLNKCVGCGNFFIGHKRRVDCKSCAIPPVPESADMLKVNMSCPYGKIDVGKPAVPAVGSFYECRTDLGPVVFQVKGVEAGYVVLASAETGTVGSVPAEMWDRDHRLGGVRLVDDTACIA